MWKDRWVRRLEMSKWIDCIYEWITNKVVKVGISLE